MIKFPPTSGPNCGDRWSYRSLFPTKLAVNGTSQLTDRCILILVSFWTWLPADSDNLVL